MWSAFVLERFLVDLQSWKFRPRTAHFAMCGALPEDYCKEDPSCNFACDGELARNWPRVEANFRPTLCVESRLGDFVLFFSDQERVQIRRARSWPMGCQLLSRTFPRWNCRGLSQGRKKYTTPPWKPLLSFSGIEASMVYTLLSGAMVYTLSLVFPGKWYTPWLFLLCDLGVGRQTEEGGVPLWWCMLFFPCFLQ